MRLLIAFLLSMICSFGYAYNPDDWSDCTEFHFAKHSPQQATAIFMNTYTGVGPYAGVWTLNDAVGTGLVPQGAKVLFLSGLLIISHGSNPETADLRIAFRRYGETYDWYYDWQTIEWEAGGGQRSTMAVAVPLSDDGKFEWKWWRTNGGSWPDWSSYGVNLSLNGWCK